MNYLNSNNARLEERSNMVEFQIAGRGITNPAVLTGMLEVPRHIFVPDDKYQDAYLDTPLQIGQGQTISQPFIVALMAQALEPNDIEIVLEIGTGSGYSAAVLSKLFSKVYTVERHEMLAEQAKEKFRILGYDNIEVLVGDGTKGWLEKSPFNAILVTAGGPKIPQALYGQLKVGGRLVIPVGDEETKQELLRVRRMPNGSYEEENLGKVRFVPLIGDEGW